MGGNGGRKRLILLPLGGLRARGSLFTIWTHARACAGCSIRNSLPSSQIKTQSTQNTRDYWAY